MQAFCPRCATAFDVREVDRHRPLRCPTCGQAARPHSGQPRPSPASDGFAGLATDPRTLRQMYEEARERGQREKSAYLAAFVSARNALERETWQTAAWDWRQAHLQLARIRRARARPLVEQAHREFVERASKQLLRFVEQMQQDFNHETAQLPEAARRRRYRKAADALRAMTGGDNAGLVDPAVVRRLEALARQLEKEAGQARPAAG